MKIGFIGQGWIGKNYADDFENRGYEVVRYSLEDEYVGNKELIPSCDIVFIAVPTPTTPEGFNYEAVENALHNVGKGKSAVIKSTILPGTTDKLQELFPDVFLFHSPEFLVEKTAAHDAANPDRNIVGTPSESTEYIERANHILSILPDSPYQKVMSVRDAELVKYAGNCFLYTKVIYMNLIHDLVTHLDGDWESVREAFANDPRIGHSHTEPVHQSGRGAGGHCFIKDFEALRELYDETDDSHGKVVMDSMVKKNIKLLFDSSKDVELLEEVYGDLNKHL